MNASEREPVRSPKVRFALMGFDQTASLRRYTFRGSVDGTRMAFTVGVDLSLILRAGIHIQELPLLCREILEQQAEGQEKPAVTLTEQELRSHAGNRPTRDAANRKGTSRLRSSPATA